MTRRAAGGSNPLTRSRQLVGDSNWRRRRLADVARPVILRMYVDIANALSLPIVIVVRFGEVTRFDRRRSDTASAIVELTMQE
ncbi:hypothetical protein PENSPDRAFT_229099 [Peniophora sp. CONT]|nr:hypothetical protein PENSPDRAFT_229099 [Peniophora sp. CONT]